MNQDETITVETTVDAPLDTVWNCWTQPEHIVRWAFASDEWEAPHAENDLRAGGRFTTVMAARDGSENFDFAGTYTAVDHPHLIEYDMDDGRHVGVRFREGPGGVRVIETFEPEDQNTHELQRAGWQAILDNFRQYTEGQTGHAQEQTT